MSAPSIMEPQNIYFYVFDGLVDYEASYALAAVNNPQFQREPGRYKVSTVALSATPVSTVGGGRILPDVIAESVDPQRVAMLILPGGAKWEQGGNMEVIGLANTVLGAGG